MLRSRGSRCMRVAEAVPELHVPSGYAGPEEHLCCCDVHVCLLANEIATALRLCRCRSVPQNTRSFAAHCRACWQSTVQMDCTETVGYANCVAWQMQATILAKQVFSESHPVLRQLGGLHRFGQTASANFVCCNSLPHVAESRHYSTTSPISILGLRKQPSCAVHVAHAVFASSVQTEEKRISHQGSLLSSTFAYQNYRAEL